MYCSAPGFEFGARTHHWLLPSLPLLLLLYHCHQLPKKRELVLRLQHAAGKRRKGHWHWQLHHLSLTLHRRPSLLHQSQPQR